LVEKILGRSTEKWGKIESFWLETYMKYLVMLILLYLSLKKSKCQFFSVAHFGLMSQNEPDFGSNMKFFKRFLFKI
jgi:hypothetical protein